MQRTRTSEVSQKPTSKLRGPRNLKTSSSSSDRLQNGSNSERTPKLGIRDRPSPSSVQSEPVRQKKLGTRITDLETQLTQAQHELKCLKQQLSSAEAAKKQAQEELHTKGIKRQPITKKVQGRVKQPTPHEVVEEETKDKSEGEETDVFEVPEAENKSFDFAISEPEKPLVCDVEVKEEMMKATSEENETLKQQLEEAKMEIAAAQKKEEEMTTRLNQLVQELEANKAQRVELQEKVLEAEGAKESLEAEMKKMKVQTEQWRKAADAAATVLASGSEMNCRVSERCGSMDKHFNGISEKPFNGYKEYLGDDDIDDDFEGGKKRGSGIRMLGDLWKKKGQK